MSFGYGQLNSLRYIVTARLRDEGAVKVSLWDVLDVVRVRVENVQLPSDPSIGTLSSALLEAVDDLSVEPDTTIYIEIDGSVRMHRPVPLYESSDAYADLVKTLSPHQVVLVNADDNLALSAWDALIGLKLDEGKREEIDELNVTGRLLVVSLRQSSVGLAVADRGRVIEGITPSKYDTQRLPLSKQDESRNNRYEWSVLALVEGFDRMFRPDYIVVYPDTDTKHSTPIMDTLRKSRVIGPKLLALPDKYKTYDEWVDLGSVILAQDENYGDVSVVRDGGESQDDISDAEIEDTIAQYEEDHPDNGSGNVFNEDELFPDAGDVDMYGAGAMTGIPEMYRMREPQQDVPLPDIEISPYVGAGTVEDRHTTQHDPTGNGSATGRAGNGQGDVTPYGTEAPAPVQDQNPFTIARGRGGAGTG